MFLAPQPFPPTTQVAAPCLLERFSPPQSDATYSIAPVNSPLKAPLTLSHASLLPDPLSACALRLCPKAVLGGFGWGAGRAGILDEKSLVLHDAKL